MPDSSPEVTDATSVVDTNAAAATATEGQQQNSDGNTSSSSNEGQKAGTMLDAVEAALKPKDASPASKPGEAEAKAESDDSNKAEGETEENDEFSEDELKALGEKVQKRIRGFTSKLKAKDETIASLEPKAKEFDKITTFIRNTGMNNNEVGELLTVGAMMKGGDVKGAIERIKPIYEALLKANGEELSPELQEKVRLGHITEDDARALSRAAADAHHSKQRLEKSEQDKKTEGEKKQREEFVQETLSAIETWETAQAKADPDWHQKRQEVSELVDLAITKKQRELNEPWFPNAKEAVEMSKAALKTVEQRYSRFKGKPTEQKQIQGDASTRSKPVPKNMLDVVNMGAA
mgnify:CR=1 FL=1